MTDIFTPTDASSLTHTSTQRFSLFLSLCYSLSLRAVLREATEAGRRVPTTDPASPGKLGITISEVVEVATTDAGIKYCSPAPPTSPHPSWRCHRRAGSAAGKSQTPLVHVHPGPVLTLEQPPTPLLWSSVSSAAWLKSFFSLLVLFIYRSELFWRNGQSLVASCSRPSSAATTAASLRSCLQHGWQRHHRFSTRAATTDSDLGLVYIDLGLGGFYY
jgi:hypothetical protein